MYAIHYKCGYVRLDACRLPIQSTDKGLLDANYVRVNKNNKKQAT